MPTPEIKKGDWVVCLHSDRTASTWGQVTGLGAMSATVRYAKGAPIWDSEFWNVEYLMKVRNEAAGRKAVKGKS